MSKEKQLLDNIVTQIIRTHDYRDLLDLHLYLDGIPPESEESFYHVFTRQLAEKHPEAFGDNYDTDAEYDFDVSEAV